MSSKNILGGAETSAYKTSSTCILSYGNTK